MASSSSIICLSAKKPPSTTPLLIPNTIPATNIGITRNNFFRPPPRRSKSTPLLLKTTPLIKHKKQDYYPNFCSSVATPSHGQVSSVPLCFSLADLLDAIDLESTDYDSLEEEEEVEEEVNLMKRWNVRELEEGIELKINMPGLGKEDVKVTLEDGTTLWIKPSEAGKHVSVVNGDNTSTGDDEDDMMINPIISFELDVDFLKLTVTEIRAEMKNGVLKIFIPKVIEEEKEKLVVDIQVE